MNKFETTMVAVLFVVLGLWWYGYRTYFAPPVQPSKQTASLVDSNRNAAVQSSTSNTVQSVSAAVREEVKEEKKAEVVNKPGEGHSEPEEFVTLSNTNADVTFSSWGGGVVSVTLKKYRATIDKKSGPVRFDFSNSPALSYKGIPGLSGNCDFKVSRDDTGRKVSFERTLPSGLEFVRSITLGDGYQLQVSESFKNKSAEPLKIPDYELSAGRMMQIQTVSGSMGYEYLGIDSLLSGGDKKVICWASKGPEGDTLSLSERFQPLFRQGSGCSMFKPKLTQSLPVSTNFVKTIGVDWVAVKNKSMSNWYAIL